MSAHGDRLKHSRALAEWLAERYSGFYVRRDPDPVDVARIHRELAEDLCEWFDAQQPRGAVEAFVRYGQHLPDCTIHEHPPLCTCGYNAALVALPGGR